MPAPIAFFAYKRPDHALRSLQSLASNHQAAESDLFIFCDGAKTPEEQDAVDQVRSVVRSQTWCGQVEIIERSQNLGLAQSIITGVTDLCDRLGQVIIVEDDLVLSPHFLTYMNNALERYASESRVMHISGYMFPVAIELPEAFFIQNASCWGWATWQRAWQQFNPDAKYLLNQIRSQNLQQSFDVSGHYPYLRMLQRQANGKLDSWAIRWYASVFLQQGLCLHPGASLVQNEGRDRTGTHRSQTTAFDVELSDKPVQQFPTEITEYKPATTALAHYFKALKQEKQAQKAERQAQKAHQKLSPSEAIQHYLDQGRKPWSTGYREFKQQFIQTSINNADLLEKFRLKQSLPEGYGEFLDERVVEYPWVLSRLSRKPEILLDAGSTLNYDYVLEHEVIQAKQLTIMTLEPEPRCYWKNRISYQFGDLRNLPFRDNWFDAIVSISTLEHIGMNNAIYTDDQTFVENNSWDFLTVIAELHRVTKPGGKVYISVPYGRYTNFGWYQQFNATMIDKLIDAFNPSQVVETYFCYEQGGWQFGEKYDCERFEGFNIHDTKYFNPDSEKDYDPDYAACSRAIAALELWKSST